MRAALQRLGAMFGGLLLALMASESAAATTSKPETVSLTQLQSGGVSLVFGPSTFAKAGHPRMKSKRMLLTLDRVDAPTQVLCALSSPSGVVAREHFGTSKGLVPSGKQIAFAPGSTELQLEILPKPAGRYAYVLESPETDIVLDRCVITKQPSKGRSHVTSTFSGRRKHDRSAPRIAETLRSNSEQPLLPPSPSGGITPGRLSDPTQAISVQRADILRWSAETITFRGTARVALRVVRPPKGKVAYVKCGIDAHGSSSSLRAEQRPTSAVIKIGGTTAKLPVPAAGEPLEFEVSGPRAASSAALASIRLEFPAAVPRQVQGAYAWSLGTCTRRVR